MPLNHRINLCGTSRKRLCVALTVMALAITAGLVPAGPAYAQAPGGMRIPPHGLELLRPGEVTAGSVEAAPTSIVVDTDTGVDDAAALVWLLQRRADLGIELLGITTVAGNTTVENATRNVFKILDTMGVPAGEVPVVEGAAKPLSRQLSKINLPLHGADGLGYTNMAPAYEAERAAVRRDASTFLCETADTHPGATLVALGPLTNVARAVKHCPDSMRNYNRVVILGGAKYAGGNQTPVAEFNFWQDPEAADLVLRAGGLVPGEGLNVTLVPFDAFGQFAISQCQAGKLAGAPDWLGTALSYYLSVQSSGYYGDVNTRWPVPDPPAMMVALQPLFTGPPAWGIEPTSGLVKVVGKPDLVRGQSVMGLIPPEQFMMIASEKEIDQVAELFAAGDLDSLAAGMELYQAILERDPPNVGSVVLTIDGPSMVNSFLADLGLTNNDPCAPSEAYPESSYDAASARVSSDSSIRLFLPTMLTP